MSSSNTSGDKEHVEEGSHTANSTSGWGFLRQYFLSRKKGWVKPACGKLKGTVMQIISQQI